MTLRGNAVSWRDTFRKYKIPYIHGCIWDRHCQRWAPSPRISLLWRDHTWWIKLPGYWRGIKIDPDTGTFRYAWMWHRAGVGHRRQVE